MEKQPLIGKTLAELKTLAAEHGMPAFAAKQIADWLYKKRVGTIDEMTNLSAANRQQLAEQYEVGVHKPLQSVSSADGTKKYLFSAQNDKTVETVYIPEDDRATLCVSSQIGCKMNCLFCMTGKQGFHGNLTAGDMLNQIQSVPEADTLTNLVFMGMGEPFDNTAEVLKTLEIITSDYGYGWSPRRITVSTVGLMHGLQVFLEKSQCHLAVSLHSPFERERFELMPVERAYPLAKVLELLRKHDFSHQRRLSFEYILFEGKNDTMRHARELVRLLAGVDCRINLIGFHAMEGVDLKSSDPEKMIAFRDYLSENGITTTIRRSRGEDILAACGMLASNNQELKIEN